MRGERDIEDNGGNITTATFFIFIFVKRSFGGSSHVDKLASVGLEQFNK